MNIVKLALRGLVGLQGAAALAIAAAVFADPSRAAAFGVSGDGVVGIGTIRGDLAGFFAAVGAFCLAAAIRDDRRLLLTPLFLFAFALSGRALTAVQSGTDAQSLQYMAVEAAGVLLFLAARAVFAKR